jgi:cytosine/uracil/thiamine/allantoin permease
MLRVRFRSRGRRRRSTPVYDYAWFVGFGVAAIAHGLLMRALPPELEPATAIGA